MWYKELARGIVAREKKRQELERRKHTAEDMYVAST